MLDTRTRKKKPQTSKSNLKAQFSFAGFAADTYFPRVFLVFHNRFRNVVWLHDVPKIDGISEFLKNFSYLVSQFFFYLLPLLLSGSSAKWRRIRSCNGTGTSSWSSSSRGQTFVNSLYRVYNYSSVSWYNSIRESLSVQS